MMANKALKTKYSSCASVHTLQRQGAPPAHTAMHDGDRRQGVRLPHANAHMGAGHAVWENHAPTLLRHRGDTEAETELRRVSAEYRYDIHGHFYRPPTKLRECFHRRVSFCPRGGEGRGGIPGTRSLPGIGYLWFHVPSRGYGGRGGRSGDYFGGRYASYWNAFLFCFC